MWSIPCVLYVLTDLPFIVDKTGQPCTFTIFMPVVPILIEMCTVNKKVIVNRRNRDSPTDELREGTSDKLGPYALRCGIKTFW